MKLRPLTGAITALVTPFRNGAVAHDDLRALVEYQIKGGINGLVPVGTTGESPTVSHAEHLAIIATVIEAVRGRVPVIAGTGSNSTAEAIDLTERAHAAGADAMLVVVPYYNKPNAEGQFQHFSAIAEATDKPIVLYSVPSRCGVDIPVSVMVRLRAKYQHVAWIKEAGGSVDRVDQIKHALGADMTVLSGDDALTLAFMSSGAEGVISVASNYAVAEVTQLVKHALANDFAAAGKLHRELYPFFKNIFLEPNPVPIKAVMAAKKVIRSAEVRLPLVPMSVEGWKVLKPTIPERPEVALHHAGATATRKSRTQS
jgi:4-hydroxy-tetrahydrodipicolinate synthase